MNETKAALGNLIAARRAGAQARRQRTRRTPKWRSEGAMCTRGAMKAQHLGGKISGHPATATVKRGRCPNGEQQDIPASTFSDADEVKTYMSGSYAICGSYREGGGISYVHGSRDPSARRGGNDVRHVERIKTRTRVLLLLGCGQRPDPGAGLGEGGPRSGCGGGHRADKRRARSPRSAAVLPTRVRSKRALTETGERGRARVPAQRWRGPQLRWSSNPTATTPTHRPAVIFDAGHG